MGELNKYRGDNPIPSEVWDSMPQGLKEIVIAAQKSGAEIRYEPNSHNKFSAEGKTFDRITITWRRDRSIMTETEKYYREKEESYNVKNGIRTSFRIGCGPGAYGGESDPDPEGEYCDATSWVS